MNDFLIIKSNSNNPAFNLAFEEYLIQKQIKCLYLWQNAPTIVIGRNQNPYLECNLSKLKEDKVYLMRRNSGGGAVYHDLGNLNITFIKDKYEGVIEENFLLIKQVLKDLKITASTSGRNDLEVDGKKISGSAFYELDDLYLHHLTLLIDVNLEKLNTYLVPNKLKLESKGITSTKSRVINLKELNQDLDFQKVLKAFLSLNEKNYQVDELAFTNNLEFKKLQDKYESFAWTYGEQVNYNLNFEAKYPWGLITCYLEIVDGYIKDLNFYTDSLYTNLFDELKENLLNVKFLKEDLTKVIKKVIQDLEIQNDLINLFNI